MKEALKINKKGKPIICRHCNSKGSHYAQDCPNASPSERDAYQKQRQQYLVEREQNMKNGRITRSTTGSLPPPIDRYGTMNTMKTSSAPSASSTSTTALNASVTKPIRSIMFGVGKNAEFDGFIGKSRIPAVISPDPGSAISIISTYWTSKIADAIITPCRVPAVLADMKTTLDIVGETIIDVSTVGDPLEVRFYVFEAETPLVLLSNSICEQLGCVTSDLVRSGLDNLKGIANPINVMGVSSSNAASNKEQPIGSNWDEDEEVLVPTDIQTGKMNIPTKETLFKVNCKSENDNKMIDRMYQRLQHLLYQGVEPIVGPPMDIELRDHSATCLAKSRSFQPRARDWLSKEKQKWIAFKYIRQAPQGMKHSSIVFPVPKGSDDWRAVVDYTGVNKLIVPVTFPMPRLDDDLDKLSNSQYWGVVDAEKGYNQIQLTEAAGNILCMQILDQLYVPLRLFPGVLTATAHFQAAMVRALKTPLTDAQREECEYSTDEESEDLDHIKIWLDDVRIDGKDLDAYLGRLERVLLRLRDARIRLNLRKCTMLATEISHCGRIFSKNGIRFDQHRTEALINSPTPSSMVHLYQFMCSVNWNRDSIPHFTEIIRPINDVLEDAFLKAGGRSKAHVRKIPLQWSKELNSSYETLKRAIANEIIRDYPRKDYSLYLFSDASNLFWSACLMQCPKDDDNLCLPDRRFRPLGFASGAFATTAQRNWDTQSKEAYGFLAGLHKFRFLLVSKVTLVTDHRNFLNLLMPSEVSDNKTTQARIFRWRQTLNTYDHDVVWISGTMIPYVDLLTRDGAAVTPNVVNSIVPSPNICMAISLIASPIEPRFALPSVEENEFIASSMAIVDPPTECCEWNEWFYECDAMVRCCSYN